MSSETIRLLRFEQLSPGSVTHIQIAGRDVAVFRVGDQVFATDDVCSHAEASLSDEGEFVAEEFKIVCGWHLGSFDVRTGQVVDSPCTKPIGTYRVWVDAGDVCTDSLRREADANEP